MDFSQLARTRQSVRRYTEEPVEREKLIACLEAARLSPSACNSQPWRFVIVDDPVLLPEIAQNTYSKVVRFNKFTDTAKAFAVVVMEPAGLSATIGSARTSIDYAHIDMANAVSSFCYQAADLGLGTCILGWFRQDRIRTILGIPADKKIGLLVSIGHPADKRIRPKVRKPLEEMSSFNRY
ncbi:MAG: nitroreductase family protein [Clostridia bacterium]